MTARRAKFVRSTVCACLVIQPYSWLGRTSDERISFRFLFAWQVFRMKFPSISKRRHIRGASSTLEEVGGMFL